MCNTLVVVALSIGERDISRTADNKHAAALSVGYDGRVAKANIHIFIIGVYTGCALALNDIKNLSPGLAVVAAYACAQVDASVCGHTNVGAAMTVVGNGNDVAVGCCGYRRNTIGDSRC